MPDIVDMLIPKSFFSPLLNPHTDNILRDQFGWDHLKPKH